MFVSEVYSREGKTLPLILDGGGGGGGDPGRGLWEASLRVCAPHWSTPSEGEHRLAPLLQR